MNTSTKTVLTAASLGLVLAGTGAGVAAAATPATTTPTPSVSTSAPAPNATAAQHSQFAQFSRFFQSNGDMQGREHGAFTVHTQGGDKTLDMQRGVVSNVAPGSVTVTSPDGYTATYTLDPTTQVDRNQQTSTTNQIAPNDQVQVMANPSANNGTNDTAAFIGTSDNGLHLGLGLGLGDIGSTN